MARKGFARHWQGGRISRLTLQSFVSCWSVQICVLAGIVVKGHKDLHNLVYPVASLGAAKQLEHILHEECPRVQQQIIAELGMEGYRTNASKGFLCEMSQECVLKIFDAVMRGQPVLVHIVQNYWTTFCEAIWQLGLAGNGVTNNAMNITISLTTSSCQVRACVGRMLHQPDDSPD